MNPARNQSPPWQNIGAVCLALAFVACALYSSVGRNEFVNYDDDKYITQNPHVQHGLNWADLKWAFTTGHTGYPHPITWLSHQLDYQLYGAWAGGHHLTNVAIHALNAVLLFLLFWRMTRELWLSAFVAAIFAIHPLHVESVAWVAERKDVLSAFFFILTLHSYATYAVKAEARWYWIALGLFIGAVLSKPIVVTLPFVLLLLDYWPLRRFSFPVNERPSGRSTIVSLILEKVPFALIALAWAIVTYIVQKKTGSVAEDPNLGIGLRLANALVSYATYVWKTFWPENLAVFYPYSPSFSWPTVVVSISFLLGVSALCLARAKSSPHLIFGWFWYVGILLPVIGLIQAGSQARADRYTYLSQIGLLVALGWEIARRTESWSLRRYVMPAAAAVVMVALAARTWNQTKVWRNAESLWTHDLAVTSDNLVAQYNLGHVIGLHGRYDEAAPHLQRALEFDPDFFDALFNMGVTRSQQNRPAEAIEYLQRALKVRPDSGEAHAELGLALAKQNNAEAAREELQQALRLAPDNADIHTNLGLVLLRMRRMSEAIDLFHGALRLNPDSAEAHNNLGLALLVSGKPRESISEFETALRLKPTLETAAQNLRRAQSQIGSNK